MDFVTRVGLIGVFLLLCVLHMWTYSKYRGRKQSAMMIMILAASLFAVYFYALGLYVVVVRWKSTQ